MIGNPPERPAPRSTKPVTEILKERANFKSISPGNIRKKDIINSFFEERDLKMLPISNLIITIPATKDERA
jgi:hypothetical protein